MVFDSDVVLRDGNVDTLVQSFNNHFSSVLDKVAPLKLEYSKLSRVLGVNVKGLSICGKPKSSKYTDFISENSENP